MLDNSGEPASATIEHVIKKADGGNGYIGNLVAACLWCNGHRGNRDAISWFYAVQERIVNGHYLHGYIAG